MLWAITSYFNPAGYRSRLANYRTFRKHLAAPLLAVELSFTGSFELQPRRRRHSRATHGGDVLWQKERLLNVALRHLPRDCDPVAWLDCDVVFSNDEWPDKRAPPLSMFPSSSSSASDAIWRGTPRSIRQAGAPSSRVVPARSDTQSPPADSRPSWSCAARSLPALWCSAPGLAWAARRALVDRHGLYDARIVGAGDRGDCFRAAIGKPDYCADRPDDDQPRGPSTTALGPTTFFADVGGRVGYVDGRRFPSLARRASKDRRYGVAPTGSGRNLSFDPFTDIAVDANGCWRWNSDKPDLHEYVISYFASRNEDGVAAIQEQA